MRPTRWSSSETWLVASIRRCWLTRARRRARGAGAQGIRPDRGPIHGIGRYPQDIEAAVYFCVLETLNNVAKDAEATSGEVSLAQIDGISVFAVVDDGTGFDTGETSYGTGVEGMADRLDTIGGALQLVSREGEGTTIEGRIPTPTSSEPEVADSAPRSG